ncbi:MAG: M23 family metallopeptidase [Anaerolineae bacterium]
MIKRAAAILVSTLAILAVTPTVLAQTPPGDPPFRLPFAENPGPSTWYIVQHYGSTRTAYVRRTVWYGSGQGLHFGVDFSARCGTEVVAIGDGSILKVDAPEHGAGPHNLLILHDNGFVSLYGHLRDRPRFAPFTRGEQGQVIGVTGDPDLTCSSRPHLHLEIRDRSLFYAYNPVDFIDADWDSLALFGPSSGFQRDLSDPGRWQTLHDQPAVQFGAPLLNDFRTPWPPDRSGW